jgi:hypothetical protein
VHTIKKNNHALASQLGSQGQSRTINRKMLRHNTTMMYLTILCAIDEFNLRERYLRIFGVYAALKSKQQSRHSQNGKRLKKYPARYPQPRSNFADMLVCSCAEQSESRPDWLLKELAYVRRPDSGRSLWCNVCTGNFCSVISPIAILRQLYLGEYVSLVPIPVSPRGKALAS